MLRTLKFRNFGPTMDDLAALCVCLLWQGYGVLSKVVKISLVSRIEDPVPTFFSHFFPSLYVLFGSICLIVFKKKFNLYSSYGYFFIKS